MTKFLKLLVLTCFICLFSGSLQQASAQGTHPQPYSRSTAQLADRFPHIVKLNFLSPFVLTANVAYEHFITPKISLQLGAFYNSLTIKERNFYWFNVPNARYRSFAFTPELRYYTGDATRPRLNGFFIAPFLRYQNTGIRINAEQLQQDNPDAENRNYQGNLNTFRVGGVAGYKLVLGERFSLEAFAGPSLRVVSWLNANLDTYQAERFLPFGLALRSGMTIGYAF